MPKSKASSLFVPTESPVLGISFEIGTLLVQAIKARRKYLSKAYTGEDEEGDAAQKLQKLQNSADDKTKLFLNELKQNVQSSSSSSYKQQQHRGKKSTDAPQKCLDFLLEVLSNTDNSFHLRRSALVILKEILDRSSDARAYLSGQILLDFVSVIENAQEVVQENNEENGTTSSTGLSNSMSPKSLFQLEAMEVIHNLASKFGQFYTQYTVASRLLGDVSVNFMHTNTLQQNNTNNNNESNSNQPQRIDMRMFRRDRDDALEYGLKACQSLERMLGKADLYFKVLVPRFGGFNTADDSLDTMNIDDSKPTDVSMNNHKEEVVEEEYDNDSINWEEGDADAESDEHDTESIDHTTSLEHHAKVNHTLDVMSMSGALLDGSLAVQVNGGESGERKPAATSASTADTSSSDLVAETDQDQDINNPTVETRQKLQKIVNKLSTTRLPRLNKWIQALIHADGMQERVVADPAAMGNEGQVSLVLISEEKRIIRGKLLQQMLRMKAEIELLLKSAATLGIRPEDDTTVQTTATSSGSNSEIRSINNGSSSMQRINPSAGIIRPSCLQSGKGVARKKRKLIKVVYNKR